TLTQGRFNSVTGNNWNRNYTDLCHELAIKDFVANHSETAWPKLKQAFKQHLFEACNRVLTSLGHEHIHISENRKLNLLLQKIASSADIVLDLHTGPKACRYLYSAEYQKHIAPE